MEAFDETKDRFDHLETYNTLMCLQAVLKEIMCRAFPTSLKGSSLIWFDKLNLISINTFAKLSQQFMSHFIGGRMYRKLATYLLNVTQGKGESLRDYVMRYNRKVLQVDKADEKVVLIDFMGELLSSKFLFFLSKPPLTNMADLMLCA